MVKEIRTFKLRQHIVINYAKRLHKKYSLSLPVDLEKIAKKYAQLRYTDIPFEIDGISANLKKTGSQPSIIVNSKRPRKRQRFTLAHEIGHVLIPWHMGTIFDITDIDSSSAVSYWQMEAEANAFAIELLMPSYWVQELILQNKNIAEVTLEIINRADVSAIAATLRLRSELPPNYIFIVVGKDGVVTYSGRSDGTYTTPVITGTNYDVERQYKHAENIYKFDTSWDSYYWIQMPDSLPLPLVQYRPWRDVLEDILEEVLDNSEYKVKFKNQLNGVIGFAHGSLKRRSEQVCEEQLYAACMQKLSSKENLKMIINHSLFSEFLISKIKDLVSKV